MMIDATFWVMISFFAFMGLLIYFKIPQKIKTTLEDSINSIRDQIDEADQLKEEAKNILTENEKKIRFPIDFTIDDLNFGFKVINDEKKK